MINVLGSNKLPTPLEKLSSSFLDHHDICLYLKRDDLMSGPAHGNKFRKLKYHLIQGRAGNANQFISFGGAFSNHLFALAAAGHELQIETRAFIRGEIDPDSPTIRQIRAWGMQLISLDRSTYRSRYDKEFLDTIATRHPEGYIIPEGGHHPLAVVGVKELTDEVYQQIDEPIQYWICPVGTGSTATGIYQGLRSDEHLLAISVLKGQDGHKLWPEATDPAPERLADPRWQFQYCGLGRFASRSVKVENFIKQFYTEHGILLDPIYNGRVMYYLYQLIEDGYFKKGDTLCMVHTGGLQGLAGYNYRYGTDLPEYRF